AKIGFLCVPMDARLPLMFLRTTQADRLRATRFVVRLAAWDRYSRHPDVYLVRTLGPMGALHVEQAVLLDDMGLAFPPFGDGALQEIPQSARRAAAEGGEGEWRVPEEEIARRRDLRDGAHFMCRSTLGRHAGADVASFVRPGRLVVTQLTSHLHSHPMTCPHQHPQVGVHIADVAFFVRPGSLLDAEARARGTSVYLANQRSNMLPEALSEGLCSLLGGRTRLAVSVIWTLDPSHRFALVGPPWFGRTVIRSNHQLSYAQAQAIADGVHPLPVEHQLPGGPREEARAKTCIATLTAFARELRRQRQRAGALELASAELRFEFDESRGTPKRVFCKQEIPMNAVVAELMVLANAAVARKLTRTFPSTAFLRRHAPPRPNGFRHLMHCCAVRGIALETSTNKTLAASLAAVKHLGDPVLDYGLKALSTRALSE
ncbi:unnamed protein product, partial [Closterium sp. Yama58-4]